MSAEILILPVVRAERIEEARPCGTLAVPITADDFKKLHRLATEMCVSIGTAASILLSERIEKGWSR